MKTLGLIITIFIGAFVSLQAETKQTCPPPCKTISTNIFGDNFCCTKKGSDVNCTHYLLDSWETGKCMEWQDVIVSYLSEKDYMPTNPAQEARKDLKERPFYSTEDKISRYLHACTNKKVDIVYSYDPAIAKIAANVYHPYAFSVLRVDSYLDFDLDPNSKLVKETVNNFLNYLCNHFDPKQFWETQKVASFHFLRQRKDENHPTRAAQTTKTTPSAPVNATKKTALNSTQTTKTSSIRSTTQLPASNAWHVLGAYFYRRAVSGNLSSVRLFETADKQQVLKINFSSGNKEPFLQKLKNQFNNNTHSTFVCKNQNILFEVQTNVYQVFILSPNAISVLAKPAGYPASAAQRKELCNFNASLAW